MKKLNQPRAHAFRRFDRRRRQYWTQLAARIIVGLTVAMPIDWITPLRIELPWDDELPWAQMAHAVQMYSHNSLNSPPPCTVDASRCSPLAAPPGQVGGMASQSLSELSALSTTANAGIAGTQGTGGGNSQHITNPNRGTRETQGNRPALSSNAVHLYRGSVIEQATDLTQPGPLFAWSHRRTYDHLLLDSFGSEVPTSGGLRWLDSGLVPFLLQNGSDTELHADASSKRIFKTASLTAPADYQALLAKSSAADADDYDNDSNTTETIDIYTLTQTETGEIYIFAGFDADVATPYQGKLVRRTTREYEEANKDGIAYTYNSDGYVSQVTTAEPQRWSIDYVYYATGSEQGRVHQIIVNNATGEDIQLVEYTYFGNAGGPSTDVGSTGDLVHVYVALKATGDTGSTFSIARHTLYRYYPSGSSDGKVHDLKMVLEPDAVERVLNSGNTSYDSIGEILQQDDDPMGGLDLFSYANRSFTYYNSNVATNSVTTPWEANENLESNYGGTNMGEYRRVKTQTIDGNCAGCGSSGFGIKRSYFHMDLNTGTDANEVNRIVVEDTEDAAGAEVSRRIYGLNYNSTGLRDVLIEDPTVGTLKAWCRSMILNVNLRVTERRMPSAHSLVDTEAEVKTFLDPYDSGGSSGSWNNDTNALHAAAGLIYVAEYNSDGYPTGQKAKKGKDGTAYFVNAADWGDGTNDKPKHLPTATYTYPTKETTRANGKKATIAYTFWNAGDTQIKQITTTLPSISTAQNGSGTATSTYQYFDKEGRLRWTKDGEGNVAYFAHHPDSGALAYAMADVETDDLPTEITSGSSGKWIEWDDGSGGDTVPTDFANTDNNNLQLVSKREYDDQGRPTLFIQPSENVSGGSKHYVVYKDNQILQFPYFDSTTNKPLLPIRVIITNDGDSVTETYSVDPDRTAQTGGVPTGLSAGTTQAHYVSWTRSFYDGVNGQLVKTLRYHDIPASGDGSHITNYYVSAFDYDDQGRRTTIIETSTSTVHQVTQMVYEDPTDRITQVKRGAGSSGANTSANSTLGTLSLPTMTKVSEMEYDSKGVGDDHVTRTVAFHGTGATDNTGNVLHRDFRGFLRGVEPFHSYNGSTDTKLGPYTVHDVDWMGRSIATATYQDGTTFTWSSVVTDDDYAETTAGGRAALDEMKFDDLGRVYQLLRYAASSGTAKASLDFLQTDFYYDRNDRQVAILPAYNAATEIAYDGAGRRYQERSVIELTATKYSSGAFQYRAPAPDPTYSSTNATGMSGGDDKVIQLTHLVFDDSGNTIEAHTFEEDYFDASSQGIDITGDDDYVRRSAYSWYDDADRITVAADYGSGDTTAGQGTWKYAAEVARPGTAPTASSDTKLVSKIAYHADTGRLETTTDPADIDTKTFYDDLGRTTYVAENYDNFNASTEVNTGDATDKSKDRVTKYEYNGLGQVVELTAMDANGDGTLTDNQATTYLYEDSIDGSWATNAIYPDSSDTTSSGTDQTSMTYNIDGSLSQRKSQGINAAGRTIIDFTYNNRRQVELQKVTQLGTDIDGHVRAIKREYDNLARLEKVTSYQNGDGTGTIRNQVKMTYENLWRVSKSEQSHEGAVGVGTPNAQYTYDMSATSDAFNDGARLEKVTYPDGRVLFYDYGGTGGGSGVFDRLNRLKRLRETSGTGEALVLYTYNGVGRVVRADYETPDFRLDYVQGSAGTYNGLDRFARIKNQYWDGYNSTSDVDRFLYDYDYASNPKYRDIDSAIYATNDKDQAYTYDGLHRLKTFDEGTLSSSTISTKSFAQDWTLDQTGNWSTFKQDDNGNGTWDLDQDRTSNSANEITGITADVGADWLDPAYDAQGNVTQEPQSGAESSTDGIEHRYTFDAWNRIVKVEKRVYSGGTPGSWSDATTAEYDGLNRRIVKVDVAAAPDVTFGYYYNTDWQVLEVRKDADTDPLEQNTWHPYYIDALAMRTYDADTDGVLNENSDGDHYYTHDANFNVTAVVDASGTVLERYHYTPYGGLQFLDASFGGISSSTIGNAHTYTGREMDAETMVYHYRNRDYSCHLGSFLSRDPIEYRGSGPSLYEYVGTRPTVASDPFGLYLDCWAIYAGCLWRAADERDRSYTWCWLNERYSPAYDDCIAAADYNYTIEVGACDRELDVCLAWRPEFNFDPVIDGGSRVGVAVAAGVITAGVIIGVFTFPVWAPWVLGGAAVGATVVVVGGTIYDDGGLA